MSGIDRKELALSFQRIGQQATPELITIVIILCAHYILEIHLDLGLTAINLVYALITFPSGYSSFFRGGTRLAGALAIGLVVGVLATAGMTVVVSLMLQQGLFPGQAEIQDFVETTVTIMLAYGAGNAMASFLGYLLPGSPSRTAGESIRAVWLALARLEGGRSITDQINAAEVAVKALLALVMAVGTLVVAIKKFLL